MAEITPPQYLEYREEWIASGRRLPLEVTRARYDNPMPLSWEVLWHEAVFDYKGGSDAPIAEFTTWREAQDWALAEARKSTQTARARVFIGPEPRPWAYFDDLDQRPYDDQVTAWERFYARREFIWSCTGRGLDWPAAERAADFQNLTLHERVMPGYRCWCGFTEPRQSWLEPGKPIKRPEGHKR